MAWRSSGTNNDEMVNNLKRFGVINSECVEDAFRSVDRRFFVPQNRQDLAHSDQPLKEGPIHISAPHIYGCIAEALDITPNSSLSFLNIGSGTGYLSSIVAHILGPMGVCYGVEINNDVIDHCLSSMDRLKAHGAPDLPHMEFIHGNGLQIDATTGESLIGYDRMYVGASVARGSLNQLASLLRPGGIMVAPVDDELLKITRIGYSRTESNGRHPVPRSIRGRPPPLSEDFVQEEISGVRFAPLVISPALPTVIRSRIWGPSVHRYYPECFRKSCKEILLCSHAPTYQPPRDVANEQINVASKLPRPIWLEILSYTHRDWFTQPHSKECVLRRRLEQEQQAVQRAQKAQLDAEARLRLVERERDGYRLLSLRWQARLHALMNERGETAQQADDLLLADDIAQSASAGFRLGGMNSILRQFQGDNSDEDEDPHAEGDDVRGEVDMESESDDEDSTTMEDASGETVSELVSSPVSSSVIQVRSRTISLSSHDT